MKETKIYCDHCGKELDDMHDYVDTELVIDDYERADLCADCIVELNNIVLHFIKKGGVE